LNDSPCRRWSNTICHCLLPLLLWTVCVCLIPKTPQYPSLNTYSVGNRYLNQGDQPSSSSSKTLLRLRLSFQTKSKFQFAIDLAEQVEGILSAGSGWREAPTAVKTDRDSLRSSCFLFRLLTRLQSGKSSLPQTDGMRFESCSSPLFLFR
jgi:hypothetical protein